MIINSADKRRLRYLVITIFALRCEVEQKSGIPVDWVTFEAIDARYRSDASRGCVKLSKLLVSRFEAVGLLEIRRTASDTLLRITDMAAQAVWGADAALVFSDFHGGFFSESNPLKGKQ